MSEFSSAQIVIATQVKPSVNTAIHSVSGRIDVLQTLLPQLCFESIPRDKQKQTLNKIDSYMLEETQQLLNKVEQLCNKLTWHEGESFSIESQQQKILLTGTFTEQGHLATSINQDVWISGSLAWLQPNYIGLAHSQELVSFSHAYAKNKQQAILKFKHFQQPNQGIKCYLNGQVKEGKVELEWRIESPLVSYLVNPLDQLS
ncbi:hypothetical protein [Paraglaciecola sp. L3A3]|uniref:hypothetical protein n=1 Tax=Paraglaciecola sp. L3A3 TaxID=2686358 RepID=UPI00131ABF68|nr:hypothetical protein [Paraglaciecola sp. L3A3]